MQKDLLEGEKKLAKGGFSLNEAKDLAIKMKSIRDEIRDLISVRTSLDNDYESNLPENKFLKKYKFIDDKLRLVDKKGRLIDADGKLIDEEGRYIDDQGNYIDKYGNRVDKDGEYLVESKPFLDDDGNPIVLEENNEKSEKPPAVTEEPVVEQKQEPTA